MAMIEQNGGKKENNLSISIEEKTTTVELLSYIGVISIDCRMRSKKKEMRSMINRPPQLAEK